MSSWFWLLSSEITELSSTWVNIKVSSQYLSPDHMIGPVLSAFFYTSDNSGNNSKKYYYVHFTYEETDTQTY